MCTRAANDNQFTEQETHTWQQHDWANGSQEQRDKMMGINNFIRQVNPNSMNFDVECLDDVEM